MKRVLLASIAAIAISAPAMAQVGGGGAGGDFDLGIGGIAGTGSVTGGFGTAAAGSGAEGFSGSLSNTRAGSPTGGSGLNAAYATGNSSFGFAGVAGSSVNFGEDCGCAPGNGGVGGGVDTVAASASIGGTDSESFSANFGDASADNVSGSAFDFQNGANASGAFADIEFNDFGVIAGTLDVEGGFGFGFGTDFGGGVGGGGDLIPDGGIGGGGGT